MDNKEGTEQGHSLFQPLRHNDAMDGDDSETSTVLACNTIPMEISPTDGNHTNDRLLLDQEALENSSSEDATVPKTCMDHVLQLDKMFWILCLSCVVVYGCVLPFNNIASGILLERNYFTDPPSSCHLQYEDMCSIGDLAPKDRNKAIDSNGETCVLTKIHAARPTIQS
jgi:hypothetical protein